MRLETDECHVINMYTIWADKVCYAGDKAPAKEGHLNGRVMLLCGGTGQQLLLVSVQIVLLSFHLYNKHSSLAMANWPQSLFPLLHLRLTPQKLLISVLKLSKI